MCNCFLDNTNLKTVTARTPSNTLASYPMNAQRIDEAIPINDTEDSGDYHERRWGFVDADGIFIEVANIHCTNDGDGIPQEIEFRISGVLLANNELSVIGVSYLQGGMVSYGSATFYGGSYFLNAVDFSSGITVSSGAANFQNSVNFNADANFNDGFANFYNIARFHVGVSTPTPAADMAQIFAVDLSAGNATLGIATERAVASDAALVSTHSLTINVNGQNYKLPLITTT